MIVQRSIFVIAFLAGLFPSFTISQPLNRFEFKSAHMGTEFRIVLYAPDSLTAETASTAAFERIAELNQIMSDFIEDSELNLLSKSSGSGKHIKVSSELFDILSLSTEISEKTGGLFDVTVGPFVQLWRKVRNMPEPVLPGSKQLASMAKRVGYQNMKFDYETVSVRLIKKGMSLDLGGIGKGYAVDQALQVLRDHGIRSALVDGGGDILLGDSPPGTDGWRITVPLRNVDGTVSFMHFHLSNRAIATSGDLFQYTEIDGQRYSHIIDPRTGLGLTNRIQVTMIAPNGTVADAYASALSVGGTELAKTLLISQADMEVSVNFLDAEYVKNWKSEGFSRYLITVD